MFYSDTLLSKAGPLARVWLAANMERKLSKKDCLGSNLGDTVDLMVEQGAAPMALRLSGQLLLGVVRIYKRKAGYLLDDCNEALLKIKMAFRPGNNDLAPDQSHVVSAETLNLPDRITEIDLFASLGDPDLLLSQSFITGRRDEDPTVLDWGTQSLITESLDFSSSKEAPRLLEDDGLELDLGLGDDDLTLEVGRRAQTPLDNSRNQHTLLEDDGLELDLGNDIQVGDLSALPAFDKDIQMDDLGLEDTIGDLAFPTAERSRDTLSPLSDIRPSEERELELSFRPAEGPVENDDTVVEAAQRIKRRKVIQMDSELELPSALIKAQQSDRSKILKPASFLPRDPMLLALLNMQKNGGFVSSIFGGGRSVGWAPELRDILSVDIIRSSGMQKRKRDSGVADLYSDEDQDKEAEAQDGAIELNDELEGDVQDIEEVDGDLGPGSPLPLDNFDDTTMPLLHPADAGPISQGTQHAVHALREHFGPQGESSPNHRQKSSVLLQDLLPEKTATRGEATKMFFEVLVLATKDAIKVEQSSKKIGEPIRIRAKRGLYGAWAEAAESSTQIEEAEGED